MAYYIISYYNILHYTSITARWHAGQGARKTRAAVAARASWPGRPWTLDNTRRGEATRDYPVTVPLACKVLCYRCIRCRGLRAFRALLLASHAACNWHVHGGSWSTSCLRQHPETHQVWQAKSKTPTSQADRRACWHRCQRPPPGRPVHVCVYACPCPRI